MKRVEEYERGCEIMTKKIIKHLTVYCFVSLNRLVESLTSSPVE